MTLDNLGIIEFLKLCHFEGVSLVNLHLPSSISAGRFLTKKDCQSTSL